MEIGLTMFFLANLHMKFWVDTFLTTTYLINRLPSSSLGMNTLYFKLYGKNLDYSSLHTFGCQCFPSLKHQGMNKFSRQNKSCVFIRYSPLHKGYRCLDPQTHKVFISWHVIFNESFFPYTHKKTSPCSLPKKEILLLLFFFMNKFHQLTQFSLILEVLLLLLRPPHMRYPTVISWTLLLLH